MINENLIVLEFSVSQQAFHAQTVKEMFERNIKNCLLGRKTDYVPIVVFENRDYCDKWIEENGNQFLTAKKQLLS